MAHETASIAKRPGNIPAALLLAESVDAVDVDGHFDAISQTWSNRTFACASAKKHNEAM